MTETTFGTSIGGDVGKESALGQAKIIGGIGSILTLLGLAPFIGTAMVVTGWVLVLAAIGLISGAVGDRQILYNGTTGAALQIVGSVGLYFVGLTLFSYFRGGNASNPLGFLGSIFDWLLLLWIVAIVSSIFLFMSLRKVASRLGAGLFSIAAIIYVIGEGTTIILIGFIIALMAQILFAAAFFSMPDTVPVTTSTLSTAPTTSASWSTQPRTSSPLERAYCSNCGAKLEPVITYCPYCGAKTSAPK
jgi:uncharacterized membrane protein